MSDNRPKEIHISTVSTVDRNALPMLCSLVTGEIYAAEMMNMRGFGITPEGIFRGFTPSLPGGLTLRLDVDPTLGYGAALCKVGYQQIQVLQQHPIDIDIPTGSHWAVTISPFYEPGILTKQVDSASVIDAVSIKLVDVSEVTDDMIVACEINLLDGATEILANKLSLSARTSQAVTVGEHNTDPLAHPNSLKVENLFSAGRDNKIELEPYSSIDCEYADDKVSKVTITYPHSSEVVDYSYNADGTVDTIISIHMSIMTTRKCTYNPDGTLKTINVTTDEYTPPL